MLKWVHLWRITEISPAISLLSTHGRESMYLLQCFSYFCLFCVFLAPLLACSSGAYSIGYSHLSVCRQTFLKIATVFFPILAKVGTNYLCANMQKDCRTDFWNFDFKIFGEFFSILHLDLVSAAAELSRPTCFTGYCHCHACLETGCFLINVTLNYAVCGKFLLLVCVYFVFIVHICCKNRPSYRHKTRKCTGT